MLLKRSASLLVVSTMYVAACGARSTLLPVDRDDETKGDALECERDDDCDDGGDLCRPQRCDEGKCLQRIIVCSDGDPCTRDECNPQTGLCESFPRTFDLDGDGHLGALPGTVAGTPEACGDDCDDTSSAAFPGNAEICDGVDNDCNGIVDDGARYVPVEGGLDAIRVSSDNLGRSSPTGLAHDGQRYFANYTGTIAGKARSYGALLQLDGLKISAEERLVQVEADNYASGTVWTGDRYGVIWSDRRNSDYEVYFATFDRDGKKMAPGDVRISDSPSFSINAHLAWTGSEFVAVWQDGSGDNGTFGIFGRRIGLDGQLLSNIVPLTTQGESPQIAVGRPGLGLVYATGTARADTVYFRPFDFALEPLASAIRVSSVERPAAYPTLEWNDDVFVVLWNDFTAPFEVFGATLTGLGDVRTPQTALIDSPGNARFGSAIPFGDRFIVVYADDRDNHQGYELYSRTFATDLSPLGPSARITNHTGNSMLPLAKIGPQGELGVLFADERDGSSQTFFTRLVCETGN